MTIKEKIKGLAKKLAEKPVRNIAALGFAGLVTITAVKDNVHFGSVTLHNPQENHYVWGLMPTITIKKGSKNTKGNLYNAGIIYGKNKIEDNAEINNMKAYGLGGGANDVGDNTEIKGDIITKGIFARNPFSFGFGSNDVIGLKNYVHKTKKTNSGEKQ